MSNVVKFKEITEIINERKFIDEILSEGYLDRANTQKILGKLAKHFYWDLGYKETRTVKALDAFMKEHYPGYHDRSLSIQWGRGMYSFGWEKTFKRLYRNATKTKICEADGIWITKAELEKIAELNNKVLERLAFVVLCYAKLYHLRNPNATGWIYSNKYPEMFKQGRIRASVCNRIIMLAKLCDAGYLYEYQMPARDLLEKMNTFKQEEHRKRMFDYRVTFMNDDSENVIFIDDWRELGYYYRRYKGENIITCAKCGRLTRGNKNGTKKYCKVCVDNLSDHIRDFKLCRCIDCGRIFEVDNNQRAKKRCSECHDAERKAHNREMYQKRKANNSTNLEKDASK